MSVADALQLMLAFGMFIVALIALIVELIIILQNVFLNLRYEDRNNFIGTALQI
ncbi:putative holin-like toxin [Latilactobacillus curvatus]|uniref:putative holin-like toxin n=1 Tax=Lactobacillaceae TaxID=33958 RepID=UPI003C2B2193